MLCESMALNGHMTSDIKCNFLKNWDHHDSDTMITTLVACAIVVAATVTCISTV